MSKVITTTVLPKDGFDIINIGAAGDTVAIAGDSLNTNVLQDAGGNNIFTSSSGTVSSTALAGSLKLLSTQTASDSATVSFTTGIDSTYDVYIFKFMDVNPATNSAAFQFQAGTGGSYATAMTTTTFRAYHFETDASGFGYTGGEDQASGTGFQSVGGDVGNDADQSIAGELHLFAPSSTTYVKHFYCRSALYRTASPGAGDFLTEGYFQETIALTQVQFKFSSGNFDGTIKLYGVSKT